MADRMVVNEMSVRALSVEPSDKEKLPCKMQPIENMDEHEDRYLKMELSAAEVISTPTGEPSESRNWICSMVFLCFYGFMASIKPGEPFITPYLLSPEQNFTIQQVTNEIIPVLTYSYMAMLVPAFLLTDFLRYKPVLIFQGISQVSIWLILLLGTTLIQMQFMEVFYGVTMACRVAYSSYIFSLVSPVFYQQVASYSRTSVLMGVFTSSVLGQVCMSVGNITFATLNGISLGFVSFGLLLSLFLPWPKRSLYFHKAHSLEPRKQTETVATRAELAKMNLSQGDRSSELPGCSETHWRDSVLVQMLLELRNVVKRPKLRLWCLWWVFNSTGYYLVLFYVHILWSKVYPATENKRIYNGGVEAASTLLSAVMSFIAGFVKIRWNIWSELVIGIITAVQAGLLLLMGSTDNIWVCYISYIVFRGAYQFLVPIATFQIASSLTKELCALVFGINTFLGTILKTIINLIIVDKKGLALDIHSQFLVYFFYFSLLTVSYLVSAAVVITRHCRNQPRDVQQATPTEFQHMAATPESLSHGESVKA
ncbi:reduced folate transporter [Thalassophryne amazonica]|uniref:reduced folate transporter n=1 Tax=Thalassophryne amazonica TaxID=390379 RepID=UPI001471C077|nr:reduced folate transporter [Thalassophryne amazonica]